MENFRRKAMKNPAPQPSDSLKKAMQGPGTFDEANYYQSKQVEMGGDDVLGDVNQPDEEDEDEEEEDHEFYGDD